MELNRERIVKALECCASSSPEECDCCPIDEKKKDDCECGRFLTIQALALIRELTEENERLRVVADMSDTTLTDALRIVNEFCDSRIKRAKADTVRKMHEKLKAEFKDCCRYIQGNREYFIVGEELIDRIAKELLEVE